MPWASVSADASDMRGRQGRLFVVIGGVVYYRECPVELFGEYGADDLVRECHGRERQHGIGPFVYFAGETVWPSDDETDTLASCGDAFFDPRGELHRSHGFPLFVEQYDRVALRYLAQYHLPLGLFLYLCRHFAGTAHVWKYDDGEFYITVDAFGVVANEGGYGFRIGFPYQYEVYRHCLMDMSGRYAVAMA